MGSGRLIPTNGWFGNAFNPSRGDPIIMLIKAKYAGTCKKCGLPIKVGDTIDWERGQGASHEKCPSKVNEYERIKAQLDEVKGKEFVEPEIEGDDEKIITVRWYEGEYLSGYVPSDYKTMEALELAAYVSGWGTRVKEEIVDALGKEFSVKQAKEFAFKRLREQFDRRRDHDVKELESQIEKFEEAIQTGKPVVVKRWSEPCNDYREECDIDNITVYANPDGTTTTSRSHTW